ncbi:MAG: hypothetical protein ACOX6T_21495 [Myxococcales bacterium]|jgi:hypothetical protein
MSALFEHLGRWVDREKLDALLAGKATDAFRAFVLAGKLLRCPAASPARRAAVRNALAPVFVADESGRLEEGCATLADEAKDLLEQLRNKPEIEPGEAFSLLLLRDDLESARHAFAALSLRNPELDEVRVDAAHDELAIAARGLDSAAAPMLDALRAAVAGVDVPEELADLVMVGENPWWLDLVDPVLRAAARRPTARARSLAAASGAPGKPHTRWEFDGAPGGLSVELYDDASGGLRASLVGKPPGEQPIRLFWEEAGEDREENFVEVVGEVFECAPARSVLSSGLVALRHGNSIWPKIG